MNVTWNDLIDRAGLHHTEVCLFLYSCSTKKVLTIWIHTKMLILGLFCQNDGNSQRLGLTSECESNRKWEQWWRFLEESSYEGLEAEPDLSDELAGLGHFDLFQDLHFTFEEIHRERS